MIFACYAGTGKTTAASRRDDTLDLLLAPFKYNLPSLADGTYEEREAMKATEHDEFNFSYPEKYVDAIEETLPRYKYILIPTDERVLIELNRREMEYLVVLPDICQEGMKDLYERRYRERGNNERFIDIFIGQWNQRIVSLLMMNKPYILLPADKFVSDIINGCDG